MLLTAARIAELLAIGATPDAEDPLVITPQLCRLDRSGASVDFRLGSWFMNLRQSRMTHLDIAKKTEKPAQLTKTNFVPFGKYYVLHPGDFVLGVTLEWLRLPSMMGAYVIGRSSWGRRGLIIATATGVHPGFVGTLTLELSNVGEIPVKIYPGMSICQLFLHTVERGKNETFDDSRFVGFRKPVLGEIERDDVADKLARIKKEKEP